MSYIPDPSWIGSDGLSHKNEEDVAYFHYGQDTFSGDFRCAECKELYPCETIRVRWEEDGEPE